MKKVQNGFSADSSRTLKVGLSSIVRYILGWRARISSSGSQQRPWFCEPKKQLVVVLLIAVAGLCGGSGAGASTINPGALTGACGPLPPPSWPNFKDRLDKFVMALCYQKQQWPHEANRRSSEGLHAPYVKLWYSPQLYRWMIPPQNRQGSISDGSVVIKEEYGDDDPTSPIVFWSVMIKDAGLWWDGWDWAVVGTEVTGSAPAPSATTLSATSSGGCAEPQFSFNGPTSINCIGCHASAISGSSSNTGNPGAGTFSTPQFVTPATEGNVNATLPFFFPPIQTPAPLNSLSGFTDQLPNSVFTNVRMLSGSTSAIPCMVPESKDLAASKPYSPNPHVSGPSLFVTSNQCASCHDATDNTPMPTHMLFTEPGASTPVNLSTYGEWRYSMMGLAGRDPIFFAQLDTESTVHSNLKGTYNPPGFIQDTCLSCHGVMGQRQKHLDKGNSPFVQFTRAELNDPNSQYAALGRDGVSCAVCHHMADEDLDDPSTYTGKFNVGPANELYGPYPSGNTDVPAGDNVIRVPMVNSVGILPVYGAQVGEAKLCASCHTIVLPVYDAKGNPVMDGGSPKTEFEQTTYFEWENSSFASGNQTCQNCHMPDNFKGSSPLAFQIANIEDGTFPEVPETPPFTSLPPDQLPLLTRTPYARHQLSGINLFALEMFDQFRTDLGLYATDGLLPDPLRGTYNGQKNAVDGAVYQAQNSTAQVSFDSVMKIGTQLQADVRILNEVGHKMPSGVSFRRAFLDFQVRDGSGNVLWESGGTNARGVITDTHGQPLVTEFFSPSQQNYQPHFWTGNPITSDQQVQIYEELVRDPQGQFTTSFLSLDDKVKDNRILPQGWSSSGPMGDITKPEGTDPDPNYQSACGCSVVRYQVPLTAIPGAATVQATLYYQSIPPYYLSQRSEDANGTDTRRLITFTNQLNVGTSYPEIANWKLKIASSGPATIQ